MSSSESQLACGIAEFSPLISVIPGAIFGPSLYNELTYAVASNVCICALGRGVVNPFFNTKQPSLSLDLRYLPKIDQMYQKMLNGGSQRLCAI